MNKRSKVRIGMCGTHPSAEYHEKEHLCIWVACRIVAKFNNSRRSNGRSLVMVVEDGGVRD